MRERPNLAARPFVDRRPVVLASALLAVLALVLSAVTVSEFVTARGEEQALAARLGELERRRSEVAAQARTLDAALQGVRWKELEREAASLRKILAARNLSWSRMLGDLERALPWDVRLITVSPQAREGGSCEVTLLGYASGRAAWLTLLGRLFADERFANPIPVAEEAPGPTNSLGHKFQIKVTYWPEGRP